MRVETVQKAGSISRNSHMTKVSLKFNTEDSEQPHFMIAKIRCGDKVKYFPTERLSARAICE